MPETAIMPNASFKAALDRRAIPPLTEAWPSLTLANAYTIQSQLIGLHLAEGANVVGAKLGFTSAAMRDAMGIAEPNYGWLTNRMLLKGSSLALADLIHPRLEPEIAFRLKTPLRGPGVTPQHVMSATASIFAALEIVDSRFIDYRFRLPDNTADNSSAAALVCGSEVAPDDLDLGLIKVVLEIGGVIVATANGVAAMGNPSPGALFPWTPVWELVSL